MNKLLELHNGGVQIVLYSPKWQYSNKNWEIKLQKSDEGVQLEIVHQGPGLEETIEGAYAKWVKITSKGAPELTLRQIEHEEGIF